MWMRWCNLNYYFGCLKLQIETLHVGFYDLIDLSDFLGFCNYFRKGNFNLFSCILRVQHV